MDDIFSVKDKTVVITGGSGFLGRQYADTFSSSGAKVVNWDVATGVDVTDVASVENAAERVVVENGAIDVLINNAAFNPQVGQASGDDHWAAYDQFPLRIWDEEFRINLRGQMVATQAVAPAMMRRKSGSIIFIASDLALVGPQNSIYDPGKFKDIAYISSKAGVLGLMRSWAAYLGPYGVRANALVPGGMSRNHPPEFAEKNGRLNMLGRMAEEGEYNGAVVFLASNASSYMTGACLVVDGGRTAW